MTREKFLIMIIGPTAVGKTSLSLNIAERYGSEIFSCDSRQLYKEMTIGTAVPSDEELRAVKHHFIQEVSVAEDYSVGRFLRTIDQMLEEYFANNDVGLCVGGTGLYYKSITDGINEFPHVAPEILEELEGVYLEQGIVVLQEELALRDPEYYKIVDIHNPRRLIRALSVIRSSGETFTHFRGADVSRQLDFIPIKIALMRDRQELYQRINTRVDTMLESGLLAEVKKLYPMRGLKALDTVGYRELFQYLDGDSSLDEAISLIKRNTRRYAKRQCTWINNQDTITQFHPEDTTSILQYIEACMQSHAI